MIQSLSSDNYTPISAISTNFGCSFNYTGGGMPLLFAICWALLVPMRIPEDADEFYCGAAARLIKSLRSSFWSSGFISCDEFAAWGKSSGGCYSTCFSPLSTCLKYRESRSGVIDLSQSLQISTLLKQKVSMLRYYPRICSFWLLGEKSCMVISSARVPSWVI